MSDEYVTVSMTQDEARALLFSFEIHEWPGSNPLGDKDEETLFAAEQTLWTALGMQTPLRERGFGAREPEDIWKT